MSDSRTQKSTDSIRLSRAALDRSATEDRQLSDDDRLDMYRQARYQSALPDLPEIDGFHVCWLTTANPRDPIHGRLKLGYQLLKPEDIPGMAYETLTTGEWVGFIGINEMLAAKLPLKLYQGYMAESHHYAPDREEGRLRETFDQIRREIRSQKGDVDIEDGMEEMARTRATPAPEFT